MVFGFCAMSWLRASPTGLRVASEMEKNGTQEAGMGTPVGTAARRGRAANTTVSREKACNNHAEDLATCSASNQPWWKVDAYAGRLFQARCYVEVVQSWTDGGGESDDLVDWAVMYDKECCCNWCRQNRRNHRIEVKEDGAIKEAKVIARVLDEDQGVKRSGLTRSARRRYMRKMLEMH